MTKGRSNRGCAFRSFKEMPITRQRGVSFVFMAPRVGITSTRVVSSTVASSACLSSRGTRLTSLRFWAMWAGYGRRASFTCVARRLSTSKLL